MKDQLATYFVSPYLIALTLALIALCVAGAWFAERTRGATLVAAGLLPFLALPASGLIPKLHTRTPELEQLAAWARANTDENAVFLFADEGTSGGSGAFRGRALRAVYVDYESRALVLVFPQLSYQWWQRWRDTQSGRWNVTAADFPKLAEFHIDYIVLQTANAIPEKHPEFSNASYVVYRVLP